MAVSSVTIAQHAGSSPAAFEEFVILKRNTVATAVAAGFAFGVAFAGPPSSGGSNSARPQIHVVTPGFANSRDAVNADVLLDRIVFPDGVEVGHADFVYLGQVLQMTYNGPIDRFRVQNGALATVGPAGISYIEDLDGNGTSVSDADRLLLAQRMELAWANRNLNNRVMLHAQSGNSFVIGLETTILGLKFRR